MIALFVTLALATPDDTVREITADGLVAVAIEVALAGIETQVGESLDDDTLTRDVRALWGKRLFTDVRAEKERLADGWRVVFHVRERPLIRRVVFGGNDGLDDEVLLDEIESAPFREPIDQTAANQDARRIETYYYGHGYPRAEVVAHIEPVANESGQADLLFDIREGPRAYVTELAIEGNVDLADEAILDVLQTCEATVVNRFLRGCWYWQEALETDLLRVQALYYDHGFVNIQVGAPEVEFSEDGNEVVIRIPVEEGGQFRIGRVEFSVEGVPPVFPVEKLQRLLDVEPGSVFNRTRLFQGIERIQAAYRWEIGMIVAITPESDVDLEGHQVHLVFAIEAPEGYPSTAPGQLLPAPVKPL